MKALLLLLIGLVFYSTISAQNTYGFRIAYNNSNVTTSEDTVITSGITRFQAGVFIKKYFAKKLFMKVNLLYNQKGNFYDNFLRHNADEGKSVKMRLNYLETSVDLGFSFKLNTSQNLHLGVGPYWAYGLSGTEKGWEESIAGPRGVDRKIDFVSGQTKGSANTQMRRVDAGINFNAEYQLKAYGFFINYALGLLSRETNYNTINRVISIGISYSLKREKVNMLGCNLPE